MPNFRLSIQRAFFLALTSLAPFSNCQTVSGIQSAFPKSFDPKHRYHSYSYDSLAEHLKPSFGITNTFVGEKVKVISIYDSGNVFFSLRPNELNRSKQVIPGYGCPSEFCDRLEKPYGSAATKVLWEDAPIYLHFEGSEKYSDFTKASAICTKLNPCYLLFRGRMDIANVEFRRVILLHREIPYIEADKVLLIMAPSGTGMKMMASQFASGFALGLRFGRIIYGEESP